MILRQFSAGSSWQEARGRKRWTDADDALVILYHLPSEEFETLRYRPVVGIPFRDITMPRSKMAGHKAHGRVEQFEPDSDTALVSAETLQSGLSRVSYLQQGLEIPERWNTDIQDGQAPDA
jgi:hypothetical protein